MTWLITQIRYAQYVLRHKWHVMIACFRRGLIWRGLTHDFSKLRPSEWFPYAASFYGPQYPSVKDFHGDRRNDVLSSGLYKERVRGRFDEAWLLHQKRNDHHWQYWLLVNDQSGPRPLPMPHKARVEMLCDWIGAGLAQGKPDTRAWYLKNREKMILHPGTREWIENELRVPVLYSPDCSNRVMVRIDS